MTIGVGVVCVLAVARLTGLVTADTITERLRERIIRWFARDLPVLAHPGLDVHDLLTGLDRTRPIRWAAGKLLTCQWCASLWIAPPAAAAAWWWSDIPAVVVAGLALAASQVTGMLSALGRD